MSFAFARLRSPDGQTWELAHGDIIGRLWSAALPVSDPRVSEAHAMISLRGGELWLLALRRRVALKGQSLGELRLEAGQRIELAEGFALEVEEVELPERVMGLQGPGLPPVVLPAVCSIEAGPPPVLVPRFSPSAPCRIWTDGERWWRAAGQAEVVELRPEDRFQVEGQSWRALLISLSGSGPSPTRLTGGVDPPLRITAAWETVTIQAGEAAPVMLSGVHARIISELVQLGGPAPWEAVAGEIWPEDDEPRALRKRWDITLSRLRNRLREGKIRPDLVKAAGTGQIELVLRAGDVVEDRS